MSITIGNLSFKNLSGPTSFRLLVPKSDLYLRFEKYVSPLILLGDEHSNNSNICELNNSNTLSTFTIFWMRLIDSLGTKNMKVQYFIESNFPEELIDSSYYINDEFKKWLYDAPKNNIMSYIPNYHNECFSKINDKCPVKTIDFHYADLRMGIEFANIDISHREEINKKNNKKITELFIDNKKTTQAHVIKHSKIRKEKIYKYSSNDYESILYDSIYSALTLNRSILSSNVAKINGTSIIKILKLLIKNPLKCAKIIFDPTNSMLNQSKLLKSIMIFSKSCNNTNDCATFCLELFYDYFVYIVKHDTELQKYLVHLRIILEDYKIDTERLNKIVYHEYIRSTSLVHDRRNIPRTTDEDLEHKAKIKSYEETSSVIANTIMMPFNDLYVLFKTWTLAPICVYNTGDAHCRHLSNFLSKLYDVKIVNTYSNKVLRLINEQQISRCLKFNNDINIDQEIFQNFINQYEYLPKKYIEEYKEKFNLIQSRINLLGKLYTKMLSGELISIKELESQCSDIEKCIKICNLSQLNLANLIEYT